MIWIRIRISLKSGIRIRIKTFWIRHTALHPWTLKSNKSFTQTVGAQLKVFAVLYRLLLQLLKKMDFSIRSFFNSTSFFQFYLAMYSTSPERGKATTTIHKYECVHCTVQLYIYKVSPNVYSKSVT